MVKLNSVWAVRDLQMVEDTPTHNEKREEYYPKKSSPDFQRMTMERSRCKSSN